MRTKYTAYDVTIREVDLAREQGETESLKVGSVIKRELMAAAALEGVVIGYGVPGFQVPTIAPRTGLAAPGEDQPTRSSRRSSRWLELLEPAGAELSVSRAVPPAASVSEDQSLTLHSKESSNRNSETGEMRLGGELVADVEQLGLAVGLVHRDGTTIGVDDPDDGDPRGQVGVDLLVDILNRCRWGKGSPPPRWERRRPTSSLRSVSPSLPR